MTALEWVLASYIAILLAGINLLITSELFSRAKRREARRVVQGRAFSNESGRDIAYLFNLLPPFKHGSDVIVPFDAALGAGFLAELTYLLELAAPYIRKHQDEERER